jgi:hypothetical protein
MAFSQWPPLLLPTQPADFGFTGSCIHNLVLVGLGAINRPGRMQPIETLLFPCQEGLTWPNQ